jgi:excinuclease ABC subunit B
LYEEFKAFFPNNAVEYFVSYYDYYQPEAYVPRSDTYIEKTAEVNEQIDRLRHSATRALLERRDVIVVASVSCIYGIGEREFYAQMVIPVAVGDTLDRDALLRKFAELQYGRNDAVLERGSFRAKGEVVEIFPSHLEDEAWRITLFGDEVEDITSFDPLTGQKLGKQTEITVYPNSHYVTPKPAMYSAIQRIKAELKERQEQLISQGKMLEEQRLRERTTFDLEMMAASGFCNGIENYSRHLTGRAEGAPPATLFDYLPDDALLFVDESHVSVPQVGGMSKGDAVRKQTLVDYGFRLPSAKDNRPLRFEEWEVRRPQTVYVSATPAKHEMILAGAITQVVAAKNEKAVAYAAAERNPDARVTEQVVRPTGLVDPAVEIKPVEGQVDDLFVQIEKTTAAGYRSLVTVLTKKMAEQLTSYLNEHGVRVRYLHSDIETLERAQIVRDLRLGAFDVLIGINLLREGLDIPEVALVAILDADKEGFLRSTTSLIQTVGRAARNVDGRALLYADVMTDSIKAMLAECERRRVKQLAYNEEHGIVPKSTVRAVSEGIVGAGKAEDVLQASRRAARDALKLGITDLPKEIEAMRKAMFKAASDLDFEQAAAMRDRLRELEELELKMGGMVSEDMSR